MSKFIEVHDNVINTDDIRRIKFLGDDIHLGLFPKDSKNKTIVCDYVVFDFAKIVTFDGNKYLMSLDLYPPQEESVDEWSALNRAYISSMMTQLYELINPIKVTGREYE